MIDIQLDDSIVKHLESINGKPENASSNSLKFDAKGTPHVLYRNEEGKLLQDTVIKSSPKLDEQQSYEADLRMDLEKLRRENYEYRGRKVNKLLLFGFGVMLLLTFYFLKLAG